MFISPEFPLSLCPFSRLCSCVSCVPQLKYPYSSYLSSPMSFPLHDRDRRTDPKQTMEFAAGVLALIRWDLSFVEFAGEFCRLAALTELHDAAILQLFRLGACHNRPMDLPDTTGLCWREGIYRCLGSFRSRAEASPLLPPLAPASSSSSLPAMNMASPPVPAPRECPPEPAPRQRPPVPAPVQHHRNSNGFH